MPADRPVLVWTREAPTCAGWYWIRSSIHPNLVTVLRFDFPSTTSWPLPGVHDHLITEAPVGCREWSGPIPLSKEAT